MVQADNLVKIYKTKDIEVVALQGLDLSVKKGEFMALIGSSGSGKSTFLNMIGGLDRPSAGKLFVDGQNLFSMTEQELVNYKKNTVGFVWQNNARNLLPYLSAQENIILPMLLKKGKDKEERGLKLLDMVGLSSKKHSKLYQLSGGEQQRVAIAIALANDPKVLLADEPTGSVDRKTSDMIFSIFKKLNQEEGQTILVVTHDTSLSKKVQRVAAIRDGKISSEQIVKEVITKKEFFGFQEEAVTETLQMEHQEYAILDRAGRLQLPKEMLEELGIKGNKVKLRIQNGSICIENPEEV